MFRPYLGGVCVNRVGGKGAYTDLMVTSCHIRLAMGLDALGLRIGA